MCSNRCSCVGHFLCGLSMKHHQQTEAHESKLSSLCVRLNNFLNVCRSIPSVVVPKAYSRRENKILNRIGAGTQPCLIPPQISKASDVDSSYLTVPHVPSWKGQIMLRSFDGQPVFSMLHNSFYGYLETNSIKIQYSNRNVCLLFKKIPSMCLFVVILSSSFLFLFIPFYI